MNKTLCIYHGGCDDGFGSAYIVDLFVHADFHYGIYQDDPPDCTGRDVLLVDFSYKRDVMERLADQATSVTVLDHHKSAESDLRPLLDSGVIKGVFDMDKSGVGLTWQHFSSAARPDDPMPWLFEYIQDRDLWRKELPNCDQVIMALRSYPQDFETWRDIILKGPDAILSEGKAIHRYYRTIVEALKKNATRATIGGYDVPVVNSPFYFASELAGELAIGEPFAACYWIHAHGVTYSLRSRDGGVDVSEVATSYGGGGHANAAGFKVAEVLKA